MPGFAMRSWSRILRRSCRRSALCLIVLCAQSIVGRPRPYTPHAQAGPARPAEERRAIERSSWHLEELGNSLRQADNTNCRDDGLLRGPAVTIRDAVRTAILPTNSYWPFSVVNKYPYYLAIKLFSRLCSRYPAVVSVYLRSGLVERAWVPAVSDIDFGYDQLIKHELGAD
jgi:hypothetical protein